MGRHVPKHDLLRIRGGCDGHAIYDNELIYPVLGLLSEAGEVADKVKKIMRDDEIEIVDPILDLNAEQRKGIALELSDVLWYLTATAADLGYSLDEIASMNIDKLQSRKRRGRIKGSATTDDPHRVRYRDQWVSRGRFCCLLHLLPGPGYRREEGFGPFEIEAGIDHLLTATELVGHNILAYDIPVLKRLHPRFDTGDITHH